MNKEYKILNIDPVKAFIMQPAKKQAAVNAHLSEFLVISSSISWSGSIEGNIAEL